MLLFQVLIKSVVVSSIIIVYISLKIANNNLITVDTNQYV